MGSIITLDSSFHLILIAGLFVVSLCGCENTVEPYGNRADTYSIYGYLTENRKLQFIRVKRLDTLPSAEKESLDATVRLTNLRSGKSETLRDSLISFEDEGSTIVTHNFWTDTPVQSETRYRLTIEQSNGDITEATTTTPAPTQAIATPDSGGCNTNFSIEFPPLEDRRRIRALVSFEYLIGPNPDRLRYPQRTNYYIGDGGTVHLRFQLFDLLDKSFENPNCSRIASDEIDIYYTYLGPEWYGAIPSDSIDFNPIESPYVINGKGFFGSLWRDNISVDYGAP